MSRRIKAFIGNLGTYEFPEAQLAFNTNFKNLVPSNKRIPGADGAFDFYGMRRAPQELGNVSASLLVSASEQDTVSQLQDELNRIVGWGKQYLFIVPHGDAELEKNYRFCLARINSISDPENSEECPEGYLRIQLNFQANDPAWMGLIPSPDEPAYNNGGLHFYNNEHTYGEAGLIYSGPRYSAIISSGAIIELHNMGSRPVRPIFKIKTTLAGWVVGNDAIINDTPPLLWGGVAAPIVGFGLRQKIQGVTINEAIWSHELSFGQMLTINCKKGSVKYSTVGGDLNGFPYWFVSSGFGFPELYPGANYIEVIGDFDTDVTLDVEYWDAWY